MIRIIICLTFLFNVSLSLNAQWSIANGLSAVSGSSRVDDITFINDSIAYAAQGGVSQIYKSTDGGLNWTLNHTGPYWRRSIEFIDESTGFCGSLDSLLYMTTDSGNTWVDISNNITPRPSGICGLSSPDDSTIYGCGIYNSPAFVIKSTDRGQSWQSINMSTYANALVEIEFISRDTGFASGISNVSSEGGVILYTTDGGINWQKVFTTNTPLDYVWKLQILDNHNLYGSISSAPSAGNASFCESKNGGITWNKRLVDSNYFDIQLIGFLDTLHGWTGGANKLYETLDGGNSWTEITFQIPQAANFNRFYKYNDSIAFFSGRNIYKYIRSSLSTSLVNNEALENKNQHKIKIFKNPTNRLKFSVDFTTKTKGFIQLIDTGGNIIEEIYNGHFDQGVTNFSSKAEISSQLVFLSIRTNEGYQYRKIVIQN